MKPNQIAMGWMGIVSLIIGVTLVTPTSAYAAVNAKALANASSNSTTGALQTTTVELQATTATLNACTVESTDLASQLDVIETQLSTANETIIARDAELTAAAAVTASLESQLTAASGELSACSESLASCSPAADAGFSKTYASSAASITVHFVPIRDDTNCLVTVESMSANGSPLPLIGAGTRGQFTSITIGIGQVFASLNSAMAMSLGVLAPSRCESVSASLQVMPSYTKISQLNYTLHVMRLLGVGGFQFTAQVYQ